MRRAGLVASLLALVLCPVAASHGGGGAVLGYQSTVEAVTPKLPGVDIRVLGWDEQLLLRNRGTKPIVVLGYQNEPYLRVTSTAVFENRNSPAAYLNVERYGGTPVPASATPTAHPKWVQIARTPVARWHDHRIHWMSKTPPPKVREHPDQEQLVFDWAVPLRVKNASYKVSGSLGYTPPGGAESGGSSTLSLVAGGVGLALVLGGALVFTRRRRAGAATGAQS